MRGGEKCLEIACGLFPDADVFTLVHQPGAVSPVIERHRIVTSFLQRVPGVTRGYRYWLPLFPAAVERFDLRGYDLVLSMSHAVAKGAIPAPEARHLCYCFSPMRYIWDLYDDYFGRRRGLPGVGLSAVASWLRAWDVTATARVDRFAAISGYVQKRIHRYYRRESQVVHPPVEDRFFEEELPVGAGEYFLVVSALAPYKRVDLAVEFARRTGEPVWIVGSGPEEKRLRRDAPPSVRFLGWQPADRLPDFYRRSRALLFPGIEDFGIVPLESQAMGRPVVALGRGGALETVRVDDPPTGVFFDEQSTEGLTHGVEALRRTETEFDPVALRRHAAKFRRDRFERELKAFVEA